MRGMRWMFVMFSFLATAALADTITFQGYDFSSFYGPEDLVINASGDLETPTANVGGFFGGGVHDTSAEFQSAGTNLVRATTDEVGPGNYAVSQLWLQSAHSGLLYEAMFGTFAGGSENSFLIQTRVWDSGGIIEFDNYFLGPRTSGLHAFGVDLLPGGSVNWYLDGSLVLTTTSTDWATQQFDRILLFAQGDAAGQISTWTDFSLSVPEPSSLAMVGTAILGLALRRRRSDSTSDRSRK